MDKWVDLQLVTELLKKDKKELHTYLASISFDIKEVEAEELNTPPEVIPPPIDNNEASPNSPSSPLWRSMIIRLIQNPQHQHHQ